MKHASQIFVPDKMRENVLLYFPEDGPAWLDNLQGTINQVARDWSLRIDRAFSNLSVNYVAPAKCEDGTDAVVKVGVPCRGIENEIAALSHFDGKGAVNLLNSDPSGGLLLLERVAPGTTLTESPDNFDAIEIAAKVMSALWKPIPARHQFPTVSEWFKGLAKVRAKYDGTTGPLPQRIFEMAESLSSDLISSTEEVVLLHGDCHHENIVKSNARGWIVIDPKGVVGEPCYELCSFLRNPLDLHERFNIATDLPRRVERFSEILEFDRVRVAAWGLAEAVLSASWDLESGPEAWGSTIALAETYATML